jgi:inactivated superfamily I helicase
MSESAVTRSEMKAELHGLQTRLVAHTERVRLEVLERAEKVETTLLKEFRKWGISFESRFKANDALVFGFNERLISVEERVSDLEHK